MGAGNAGAFVGIAFAVVLFWLFLWSIVWSYEDAESRGKSGCLVALFVAIVSWPLGLIAWLVFRPERKPRDKG